MKADQYFEIIDNLPAIIMKVGLELFLTIKRCSEKVNEYREGSSGSLNRCQKLTL